MYSIHMYIVHNIYNYVCSFYLFFFSNITACISPPTITFQVIFVQTSDTPRIHIDLRDCTND